MKHNTSQNLTQRKRAREEERNGEELQKLTAINKMEISTYLSIITLNVNGLNSPFKRHKGAEWIKKQKNQNPSIY